VVGKTGIDLICQDYLSFLRCTGGEKSMCLAATLGIKVAAAKLLLARWESWYCSETLHITTRQNGEVVLPDTSTGQSPGTLAGKLSRCKEGMAHFLPSGYKFG
jgi:hypothetical protein